MTENHGSRSELVALIRKLAREEAYEILDEHLRDCEHEAKSVDGVKDHA